MKEVCVFCEKWGSGGIETFLINVLSRVDKTRFHVTLVAVKLESTAYLPQLEQIGIELQVFPESAFSSHFRFLDLYKMLKNKSYDVIHFNLYEGIALGYVWAAKRAGVPVRIVHSHNAGLRKSRLRPLKLLLHNLAKWLWGYAGTKWIACSRKAAEFLFPASLIRQGMWELVPNGIMVQKFQFDPMGREQMRRELGLDHEFVIGCIGRLCFQKNQHFLLQVFRVLKSQCPDSKLFFVGEGEDLRGLQKQAKLFGISDSVIFYGVTDRVHELLWAFDALAFPSRFEGLGIVAIEAQAAGLPVVCSDHVPEEVAVTALAEFLSLDNVDQWANVLLTHRGQKREDTSLQLYQKGYAIKDVAERIQNLWDK